MKIQDTAVEKEKSDQLEHFDGSRRVKFEEVKAALSNCTDYQGEF